MLRQDGTSDELIDYDPRDGDKIVLPAGLADDDIFLDEPDGNFPSIRVGILGERLATISSTIDFSLEGFTREDVRNSFITFEDFQANS